MKRHALDPSNINWTGSEYKLMEQRRAKRLAAHVFGPADTLPATMPKPKRRKQ